MANEITVNLSVACTNGKLKERFEPGAISVNQAAAESYAPTVVVGTSEEDLPVGDVATPGILVVYNLDSTNYVTYGPKSGGSMVAMGQIKAGDPPHLIRLASGVTLRWVANGSPVKVKALMLGT